MEEPTSSRNLELLLAPRTLRREPASGDLELMTVGSGRIKLRRGITMDSGAARNVMPRKMVRDQSRIRPSEGSRRGAHYVAANNGRIPNEGEFDFVF